MLDSAVREQQAELELRMLSASQETVDERLVSSPILRVDQRYNAIESRRCSAVELEDPIDLVGPSQLLSAEIPLPVSKLGDSLGAGEQRLAHLYFDRCRGGVLANQSHLG
ncbi:MAG: hypothetical protein A2289_09990 [Deltaproteobacteria bacterium RIFOXYA12_FULL_58_15]|nr:MAG: hypothetical protein A2289_09990 [Deltaproteobacteria bacterium RIFOXYA12_FULL_58_15]